MTRQRKKILAVNGRSVPHVGVANGPTFDLDAMLTPEECAKWLRMKPREFDAKVNEGVIPCVRISRKTRRFHPRTVLQKLK
jgi:hypothetical protein